MFSDGLIELARRKERLIMRAGQQRAVIATSCLQLQKPLGMIDRGIAMARYLKAHPLALAAGITVAAVLGRRSLLRWAGRGLFAWRAWHSVRAWTRKSGVWSKPGPAAGQ